MELFNLKENNINIKREFLASLTVFIMLFSIIIINAKCMENIGIAYNTAIFTLILTSAIVCIIGGFITNLPLGLTIGLGLNSVLTFIVVDYLGLSWAGAMAIVFITSLLFLIISITPLFKYLINFIPAKIKLIIPVGIGFYLLYISLVNTKFIVKSTDFLSLNNMLSANSIIILFGIFFIIFLYTKKYKHSFLIGMLTTIILSIILTIIGLNTPISMISYNNYINNYSFDLSLFGLFLGGFSELTQYPLYKIITLILTLLLIWFTDVSANIFILTNFSVNSEKNKLIKENSKRNYIVVGLSALIGSILGTSFITSCSEQLAGPIEGGKSYLVTLFLGILFLISLLFIPILSSLLTSSITIAATIILSIILLKQLVYLDLTDFSQTAPLFVMILISVISTSIGMGIIIAVLTYFVILLANGEWKELKWYNLIIYLFFIAMFILMGQMYM